MREMTTQTNNELAQIALTDNGVALRTIGQAAAFAELLQRGGMLPKGTTVEGAVVAILAGARLGLDPFQAVQGIATINGRPAIWGDTLVAIVKASGQVEDERVEYVPIRRDCKGVRYTVKRKGIATPYEGTFTLADADKAGLRGKPGPWTQYPERMMLARARAFALRDGFADILRGMRVAEEERDVVATVEATPQSAEAPASRKKRASASALIADMPQEVPTAAPEAETAPEAQTPAAEPESCPPSDRAVPDFL